MATNFFRAGGVATDTASQAICLNADAQASNYDTLQSPEGTGYVVPAAKTLYIGAWVLAPNSANTRFEIGYADTSASDSASTPTNAKVMTKSFIGLTANQIYTGSCLVPIPTGKYPFIQAFTGRAFITIFGVEI